MIFFLIVFQEYIVSSLQFEDIIFDYLLTHNFPLKALNKHMLNFCKFSGLMLKLDFKIRTS